MDKKPTELVQATLDSYPLKAQKVCLQIRAIVMSSAKQLQGIVE